MDNGILVQDYLTDKGAFKANAFVKHINETHQLISFCGTNDHHQNGVAERSIQSISNMARSMILHASIHWKDGIFASLWPQSVTNCCSYLQQHSQRWIISRWHIP
jgi:hypothetical protein